MGKVLPPVTLAQYIWACTLCLSSRGVVKNAQRVDLDVRLPHNRPYFLFRTPTVIVLTVGDAQQDFPFIAGLLHPVQAEINCVEQSSRAIGLNLSRRRPGFRRLNS
jgi:hypothetical protein